MGTSNWIEDMIDWARGLLEPLALYAPFVVLALLVTAIGWSLPALISRWLPVRTGSTV